MACILEHQTEREHTKGTALPYGATIHTDGINFSIFSQYAQEVFLLLFDEPDQAPTDIIKLECNDQYVWSVFINGLKPNQLYGYKIKGPYHPGEAGRFNENKLLMDPYARALTSPYKNVDHLLYGYRPGGEDQDLTKDTRDNTDHSPKSIAILDTFDWQEDTPLNIPIEDLIIYEVHARGFTAHPSSNVKHPGTYPGFIEKIPYLQELGINAVELLPVFEFYNRDFLVENGLSEYWGYNTIGFFMPACSYSTQQHAGCQIQEFKMLVRELHKAGIEVILDVVYNHTGEIDELGPTLCFRGIDNGTYYLLSGPEGQPYRYYRDDITGCGNTLNIENPTVLRLVLDSLRYWVEDMHVDGFRFDLAPVITHPGDPPARHEAFFSAMENDPVLKNTKIIIEPWHLRSNQMGHYPAGWGEWNDHYRNTIRRALRGDEGQARDMSLRIMGSPETYTRHERHVFESINFITAHDGFTLNDLFSYNHKHNEANKEHNRDGTDENFSWNCGIEGPTENEDVIRLRKQMIKNAYCYLLFSFGTPMMLAGDEFMRTQQGNNNTYCQDNEINWINWELLQENHDIFEFVKNAIVFRKQHKILTHRKSLPNGNPNTDHWPDATWYSSHLDQPDWHNPTCRLLCLHLDGQKSVFDYDSQIFFIFNTGFDPIQVMLPPLEKGTWHRIIDTSLEYPEDSVVYDEQRVEVQNTTYLSPSRSVVVLSVNV